MELKRWSRHRGIKLKETRLRRLKNGYAHYISFLEHILDPCFPVELTRILSFYVYPLGPILDPISVVNSIRGYDSSVGNTCQGLKGSVRLTKLFGLL